MSSVFHVSAQLSALHKAVYAWETENESPSITAAGRNLPRFPCIQQHGCLCCAHGITPSAQALVWASSSPRIFGLRTLPSYSGTSKVSRTLWVCPCYISVSRARRPSSRKHPQKRWEQDIPSRPGCVSRAGDDQRVPCVVCSFSVFLHFAETPSFLLEFALSIRRLSNFTPITPITTDVSVHHQAPAARSSVAASSNAGTTFLLSPSTARALPSPRVDLQR